MLNKYSEAISEIAIKVLAPYGEQASNIWAKIEEDVVHEALHHMADNGREFLDQDSLALIIGKVLANHLDMASGKSDGSIEEAIKAVSEIDVQSGVPQSVYVIEECSELIKELMKKQRGKGSEKDILAEACDVLTTTFIMLTQHGVSKDYVKAQILYKCNRAFERYHKTGEV